MLNRDVVSGLVLAGGQGQRMGGEDKGWVEFRQRPLVEYAVQLLRPRVSSLLISCNRNIPRYSELADITVADELEGYQGPLAGIQAALRVCETDNLLILPCDTPLLSDQVIERLLTAAADQPEHICVLSEAEWWHPLHAVIPRQYAGSLDEWLSEGRRGVQGWMRKHPFCEVDVGDLAGQLQNLNSPDELQM
ncbi:molybdenum cofactor guanylyltransferase MobA [Aliamphritea ceti]|uniref:molybdenum cofactor guanylyltransferase MobA n=1 Tax=Aliamphritea ceti TaxID=1524258 RepID=UPI0021C327A8|nr:molybdenum cofactor guanylyltransferase MobA [Aliamphritea ceti]